jgi:hypothetical protein
MKRLRTLKLFQIFSTVLKLKNQKHIAVDVLLKGFPMVPLSCRSNLAGRTLPALIIGTYVITTGIYENKCEKEA